MKKILFLIILLMYLPVLNAETIYLKSGATIEAKIIERTKSYIKIDYFGESVTYWMYEIESIDEQQKINAKSFTLNKQANYINKKFNFKSKIPEKWYLLSEDKNKEHFSNIKDTFPSIPEGSLVCFVTKKLYYLEYDPFPFITVAKSRDVQGSIAVANARAAIEQFINQQKQIIAENEKQGLYSRTSLTIIKNNAGEEIVRSSYMDEEKTTGAQIEHFLYMYFHINKDNTKAANYSILCSSWANASLEYIDIFDDFAKNFVALE